MITIIILILIVHLIVIIILILIFHLIIIRWLPIWQWRRRNHHLFTVLGDPDHSDSNLRKITSSQEKNISDLHTAIAHIRIPNISFEKGLSISVGHQHLPRREISAQGSVSRRNSTA
ncbi:hypothetical protein TorRG33x02_193310, partial [Trema orientale]